MSPDSELEELLRVLIKRFGSARSLGEVYAVTYYTRVVREGRSVSMSEIAEHTGVSTKSLSRWAQGAVRRNLVKASEHPDDRRVKDFAAVDFDHACRHLPEVAAVFGVEMDLSRMDRLPGKSP